MSKTEVAPQDTWQRVPFSLAEQLKILLIFMDALPFRTTQQEYPNRLDVGEASALVDWPEEHLHWLIHRAIECDLVATRDDRFYMTEAVEEWEDGIISVPIEESTVPFYENLEGGATEPIQEENGAFFKTFKRLLGSLRQAQAFDPETIQERFTFSSNSDRSQDHQVLLENRLRQAYQLGWIDLRFEEKQIVEVELNERGEAWLEDPSSGDTNPEIDQSLPVILQPDGQMMIPLEFPLSSFRKVHPFVLLTDIDNMVKYSMDQRSLVNAENEGWNTSSFRGYLEELTGPLPETVEALFQESDQEAESIRIEDVHHLLTFERGATAAEAMRVLSNYQPERIDENRLLLRSSTTADTIKKNLSRAGIRIQMDTGSDQDASPLLELEDNSPDDS